MKESNLLRLALIIKAGNTQTFNSSLTKIIQMILFESNNYCLNIDCIRKGIAENYELEFTNEEISKAINRRNSGIETIEEIRSIVVRSNKCKEKETLYKLEDKTIDKFKTNEANNPYKTIISSFIEKFSIDSKSPEQIEEVLNRFLYYIFNSNKKTLLLLFNNEKAELLNNTAINFNEDDKRLINDFLNWDDDLKNSFIYNAVSYSVDYCMLTIKKDYSSYKHLFRGKVFYLDANVIFRMAGINNEERKSVTNSFIKKCTDNGISIKYTNITYQEVIDTIRRQVRVLRDFYNGKRPVDKKHFQAFSRPFDNMDFVLLYDKWCKQPGTKFNDYGGFEKHIIKRIDDILKGFEKVDYISFENTEKKMFNELMESLKEYKSRNRANYTDRSIAIDVNNYLYVYKMRESKRGSNFVDISDYFITTDGNLYDWGKEILPSTIPIAVLPSVWHSLLLKFKGRTDDDYKAFTLFLNLRYKVSSEGFDERRPEILNIVQNMDEPTDLKDMMLSEISDNLLEKYSEIEDVYEIIEDAKNTVIESEIQRINKENGQPLIDKGKEEGRLQALFEIAESKAQKRINRNNTISKIFERCKIALGIMLLVGLVIYFIKFGSNGLSPALKTEILGYDISGWSSITGLFIAAVSFFLINPIKNQFFSKDFKTLKEEEYKKLISSLESK